MWQYHVGRGMVLVGRVLRVGAPVLGAVILWIRKHRKDKVTRAAERMKKISPLEKPRRR